MNFQHPTLNAQLSRGGRQETTEISRQARNDGWGLGAKQVIRGRDTRATS